MKSFQRQELPWHCRLWEQLSLPRWSLHCPWGSVACSFAIISISVFIQVFRLPHSSRERIQKFNTSNSFGFGYMNLWIELWFDLWLMTHGLITLLLRSLQSKCYWGLLAAQWGYGRRYRLQGLQILTQIAQKRLTPILKTEETEVLLRLKLWLRAILRVAQIERWCCGQPEKEATNSPCRVVHAPSKPVRCSTDEGQFYIAIHYRQLFCSVLQIHYYDNYYFRPVNLHSLHHPTHRTVTLFPITYVSGPWCNDHVNWFQVVRKNHWTHLPHVLRTLVSVKIPNLD